MRDYRPTGAINFYIVTAAGIFDLDNILFTGCCSFSGGHVWATCVVSKGLVYWGRGLTINGLRYR